MRRARLVAVSVVLALCTGMHPAAAEPAGTEREARQRFAEAETEYRAGHYAQALPKYQAGYAALPLPGFLVNIAQCQRRLGDLKAARATYREFVLVAPDSRLVPEVERLLRDLDRLIADLAAGGDGAMARDVGADDVHTTELPPAVRLAPADPAPATAPLLAAPAAPESGPPARRSRARWWIWGGITAAVIAGGIAGAIALSSPGTTTIRAGSLGTLSR